MSEARWRFPRGAEALSPQDFDEIQRARIFEALCALIVSRGYAKTTVSAVVGSAGVSTKTFYDYFDNKEDCLLATYRAYGAQLGAELAAAWSVPERWAEKVAAAVDTLLGFGAQRPDQLRLLLLDASAAAPGLLPVQRKAVALLSARLREGRAVGDGAADPAPDTEEMVLAALAQRVGRCLLEAGSLADLRGELVEFALAPYLGGGEAREFAGALPPAQPASPSASLHRPGGHLPALSDEHRRRAFDSLVALLAEHPYGELTVTQIRQRAGISSRAFNSLFESKDDCLIAAYRAFAEQLQGELLGAYEAEGAWPDRVRAAITTALGFAVEHPDAARLLAHDIRAAGPVAQAAQDESIERLATRLREDREPAVAALNRASEALVLAGVLTLVGNRLAAGELAALPGLEDDLTELVLASSRGWS